MIRLFILIIFLHLFNSTFSFSCDTVPSFSSEFLKEYIRKGLVFLKNQQQVETSYGNYYKGEWPTYMHLKNSYPLMGKRKRVEDSNCFSVASTHNALAKIYLLFPEYVNIPEMLDLSFERIMGYRNGNTFNFWNELPPGKNHSRKAFFEEQPLVRRPTKFTMISRFIHKSANIADDADDTSLAYAAMYWRSKSQLLHSRGFDSLNLDGFALDTIFSSYRDKNRNNRHWYNCLHGSRRETGAFLTWLGEEYQFKKWNLAKEIGHDLLFFMPFSQCYPRAYQPYIPFGSNDLDAVVNANILSTLSLYKKLNTDGVEEAIDFIENRCKRQKYDRVSIYYPNRYHFAYAVSQSWENGVSDLGKSVGYIVDYLLSSQEKDGGWSSRRMVNKKDRLQSTAFALNALISAGDYTNRNTLAAIDKAIHFIVEKATVGEEEVFWEGGVFFSGGTLLRNTLFWESDAYTTAIILQAFASYCSFLENGESVASFKNSQE